MQKVHAMTTRKDTTYPEWHGWVLTTEDEKTSTLTYEDAGDYWIPLGLKTSAEVLDWIVQVSQKTWATNGCIAGLVRALDAYLNLQANFCGSGIEQPPPGSPK